jgi:hypothetical protein
MDEAVAFVPANAQTEDVLESLIRSAAMIGLQSK